MYTMQTHLGLLFVIEDLKRWLNRWFGFHFQEKDITWLTEQAQIPDQVWSTCGKCGSKLRSDTRHCPKCGYYNDLPMNVFPE